MFHLHLVILSFMHNKQFIVVVNVSARFRYMNRFSLCYY